MLPAGYKVIDGGLATEFERRGHEINDDPLWSARLLETDPNEIIAVHRSYLDHGADVIITATYQANIDNLSQHFDIDECKARALIRKGVELAKTACNEFWQSQDKNQGRNKPLVAGSVGPFGATLHDGSEYNGHYVDTMTIEELKSWHLPRLECLLEAGVDIIAFETIPALKEAEALLQLLQQFPQAKAWLSFSCKSSKETCHEEQFAEVVKVCVASDQLVAIGINCTNPKYIEGLLDQAKSYCGDKPLIIYPNSGESWAPDKGWFQKDDDFCITDYVEKWINKGANWIGGCCRTNPQDIADIRQIMIQLTQKIN